jgi:hypothetical protein
MRFKYTKFGGILVENTMPPGGLVVEIVYFPET